MIKPCVLTDARRRSVEEQCRCLTCWWTAEQSFGVLIAVLSPNAQEKGYEHLLGQ